MPESIKYELLEVRAELEHMLRRRSRSMRAADNAAALVRHYRPLPSFYKNFMAGPLSCKGLAGPPIFRASGRFLFNFTPSFP
jgi:hypothetical protein